MAGEPREIGNWLDFDFREAATAGDPEEFLSFLTRHREDMEKALQEQLRAYSQRSLEAITLGHFAANPSELIFEMLQKLGVVPPAPVEGKSPDVSGGES